MTRRISAAAFLLLCAAAAQAAEAKPEAPKTTAAAPAPPAAPVAVESDKAKDWKNLQAQEQWVTRLKKQTDGEVRQLSEMRGQVAEKYKLDPKKFEAGAYIYDEKKDAFVER